MVPFVLVIQRLWHKVVVKATLKWSQLGNGEPSTISRKLCIMADMDYNDYDEMGTEHLATIRDYALNRVQLVTEALKKAVREEHKNGTNIKKIARKSGVTRATIYAWLAE